MADAPERIWIDAWGGNWSPVAGGTQTHEYIRADLARPAPTLAEALDVPEVKELVEAACQFERAIGLPNVELGRLRVRLYAALVRITGEGTE